MSAGGGPTEVAAAARRYKYFVRTDEANQLYFRDDIDLSPSTSSSCGPRGSIEAVDEGLSAGGGAHHHIRKSSSESDLTALAILDDIEAPSAAPDDDATAAEIMAERERMHRRWNSLHPDGVPRAAAAAADNSKQKGRDDTSGEEKERKIADSMVAKDNQSSGKEVKFSADDSLAAETTVADQMTLKKKSPKSLHRRFHSIAREQQKSPPLDGVAPADAAVALPKMDPPIKYRRFHSLAREEKSPPSDEAAPAEDAAVARPQMDPPLSLDAASPSSQTTLKTKASLHRRFFSLAKQEQESLCKSSREQQSPPIDGAASADAAVVASVALPPTDPPLVLDTSPSPVINSATVKRIHRRWYSLHQNGVPDLTVKDGGAVPVGFNDNDDDNTSYDAHDLAVTAQAGEMEAGALSASRYHHRRESDSIRMDGCGEDDMLASIDESTVLQMTHPAEGGTTAEDAITRTAVSKEEEEATECTAEEKVPNETASPTSVACLDKDTRKEQPQTPPQQLDDGQGTAEAPKPDEPEKASKKAKAAAARRMTHRRWQSLHREGLV